MWQGYLAARVAEDDRLGDGQGVVQVSQSVEPGYTYTNSIYDTYTLHVYIHTTLYTLYMYSTYTVHLLPLLLLDRHEELLDALQGQLIALHLL